MTAKKRAICLALFVLFFVTGALYAESCYETGPFYYSFTYVTTSQCPPYVPGASNYCCGFQCYWSLAFIHVDLWYCMSPGWCILNNPQIRPCYYY
jgi:hypothetical protein